MQNEWLPETANEIEAATSGTSPNDRADVSLAPIAEVAVLAGEPLADLHAKLTLALRTGRIGLWEWNAQNNVLWWDARMYEIYGIAAGTPITSDRWKAAVHPEDLEAASGIFSPTVQQELRERYRFRIVHPRTGVRWIEAAQEMLVDSVGNLLACVGCDQDVTEMQERPSLAAEAPPQRSSANSEELSGGSSRPESLGEHLANEVGRVRRYGGKLTVLAAELDNFDEIVRQFGPEIGDLFLRSAMQTIGATLRATDWIACRTANEFCVVLPGTTAEEAKVLGNRIRSRLALGAVYPLNQPLTASLGVAQWESDDSAEALQRRATLLLRRAQAEGGDQAFGELASAAREIGPTLYPSASPRRSVILSARPDYCVHCFRPLAAGQESGHRCMERTLVGKPASPPPYN